MRFPDLVLSDEDLDALLLPAVEAMGLALWGCRYSPAGKYSLLRVYIDSEKGVTADDCAAVSRQVSTVLNVEGLREGTYQLEVSSPGLDRPLWRPQHFEKSIGRDIEVTLRQMIYNRRHLKVKLLEMKDNAIFVLNEDGMKLQIALSNIQKAHLIV